MKIGNLVLPEKALFLAPMEDVTDASFRIICKEYGADMVYTEFVSTDALVREIPKSIKKMELLEDERPAGIQLYGHIPENMVESAKMAAQFNPDVIDINCGCPVKKIANRGAGAGLLNNLPLLVDIARQVVAAVNIPVTVKTRLGWDASNTPIVHLAEALQDVGVQAIAIHGRTRAQLYTGQADWSLIGQVKNNPRMNIPVIGNGDINSPEKAAEYFNRYGVDGIMIGRASVGRPYIFKEIKHFLKTGELLPPPNLNDLVDLATEHFRASFQVKGDKAGIYEMRRHFNNYFKGLPDFKPLRIKLLTSNDYDEILELLEEIRKVYGQ